MTGQRFTKPGRVVVLLESDGQVYGFDVEGEVAWQWTGLKDGRSTATLTAKGVFQRKWRSSPAVEGVFDQLWQAEREDAGSPPALEE